MLKANRDDYTGGSFILICDTILVELSTIVSFLLLTDVLSEEQNIVSPGHGATFNMKHELYELKKFSTF